MIDTKTRRFDVKKYRRDEPVPLDRPSMNRLSPMTRVDKDEHKKKPSIEMGLNAAAAQLVFASFRDMENDIPEFSNKTEKQSTKSGNESGVSRFQIPEKKNSIVNLLKDGFDGKFCIENKPYFVAKIISDLTVIHLELNENKLN